MECMYILRNLSGKKGRIHCLLVKPNYYTTYPPLGLLKISALVKQNGNTAELVSPPHLPIVKPDIILVTSLFTYGWEKVKEAVDFYRSKYPDVPVVLGGIYATLMREHAREMIKPEFIWEGIIQEAEDILPDYSLVPDWNASILFSSRGCIRRCPFCVVWRLEPEYKAKNQVEHLIDPAHDKVIFWDNNFLASPYKFEILDFLETYRNSSGKKVEVDFNQGLDARLITPLVAEKLSKLKLNLVRLAYDRPSDKKYLEKAIRNLKEAGISSKKILVYTLFNFTDTPQEFLEKLKDLMTWEVAVYPMRYQPNNTLTKDKYISPGWTGELLEMVARARRVLGTHGAFPPYEGLKKKILSAKTLEEAMHLREPTKRKVRVKANG